MKLAIELGEARLRAPAVSARDSVRARPLLLVSVTESGGAVGFGEAAPLAGYDGVSVEDVRAALEDCRPALSDADGEDRHAVLDECRRRAVLPQAVAAVDLALWDLAGRRAGEPVWRLLGAAGAAEVEVNATIAVPDRAGAAAQASSARRAGFRCVKVKVGIGDEAGRIAAVRAAAGVQMAIRLDANGAWAVEEALAALRVLAPAQIELCEEPVSGLAEIESVAAAAPVPVALDESAALPGALDRRRCDAICLKITRCGGISGVIEAARQARRVGYEVYLASTYDGPLGIAAALHAAAAVRPDRACGLATLDLFESPSPLRARSGAMAPPPGPGLGTGLTEWYRDWSR